MNSTLSSFTCNKIIDYAVETFLNLRKRDDNMRGSRKGGGWARGPSPCKIQISFSFIIELPKICLEPPPPR